VSERRREQRKRERVVGQKNKERGENAIEG
jgi:hypothetical protein